MATAGFLLLHTVSSAARPCLLFVGRYVGISLDRQTKHQQGGTVSLNDTFIKNHTKHSDGGRLYLHVTAAGKYWRMNYRLAGKQKTLAPGIHPALTRSKSHKGRQDADGVALKDTARPVHACALRCYAKSVQWTHGEEVMPKEQDCNRPTSWRGDGSKPHTRNL